MDDGESVGTECLRRHLSPNAASECLDDDSDNSWANGSLVTAPVETIATWPWDECTPRTTKSAEDSLRSDFTDAIRESIEAQLPMGQWTVLFFNGIPEDHPIGTPWGISYSITYTL